MKKMLLLFLCLFGINSGYGYTKDVLSYKYDTLSNIQVQHNKDSYLTYVGQSIYFYEYSETNLNKERYITDNFVLLKPDTTWINKKRKNPEQFKDYNVRTAYGAREGERNATPANQIEGKTFKIVNCEYISEKNKVVFILEDPNKLLLYWNIPEYTYEDNFFPCIITSFYDKLRDRHIGKNYVVNMSSNIKYIDLMSGNYVNARKPSQFAIVQGEPLTYTCVGLDFVAFEGKYKIPLLLFKNEQAIIGVRPISLPNDKADDLLLRYEYPGTAYLSDFEPYETYKKRKEDEKLEKQQKLIEFDKKLDECKKLYGERIGTMIMLGDIEIGMTREMCLKAWGLPDENNKTTNALGTTYQWVYNNKGYLYFNSKGLLESIRETL